MHNNDRVSESVYTTCFSGRNELLDIIQSCSLLDFWLETNHDALGHTWFDSGIKQSSRLDRIYGDKNFRVVKLTIINFPFSDHRVLTFDIAIKKNDKIILEIQCIAM